MRWAGVYSRSLAVPRRKSDDDIELPSMAAMAGVLTTMRSQPSANVLTTMRAQSTASVLTTMRAQATRH